MSPLATAFTELPAATTVAVVGAIRGWEGYTNSFQQYSDEGFKSQFWDRGPGGSRNQVRHAAGGLVAGFINILGNNRWSKYWMNQYRERKSPQASREADVRLNNATMPMGAKIAGSDGYRFASTLGAWIRENLCGS